MTQSKKVTQKKQTDKERIKALKMELREKDKLLEEVMDQLQTATNLIKFNVH